MLLRTPRTISFPIYILHTTERDRHVVGGFVKNLTMPGWHLYMHLHVIQIKTRIRVFMR